MNPGADIFLVCEIKDQQQGVPYVIVEAKVVSDAGDDTVILAESGTYSLSDPSVPRSEILHTREDAEHKLWALAAWCERKRLKELMGDNAGLLPTPLAQPTCVYASGNPLRWGEQRIAVALPTNTTAPNKKGNVQKCLQIAASIYEDLGMLLSMLSVLSYANDYAKKMVGKYVIVELVSLHDCLNKLSQIDRTYRNGLFLDFKKRFDQLESQYKLLQVRNKVGAHRDVNIGIIQTVDYWQIITRRSILTYITFFEAHLREVFKFYRCSEELKDLGTADNWDYRDRPVTESSLPTIRRGDCRCRR